MLAILAQCSFLYSVGDMLYLNERKDLDIVLYFTGTGNSYFVVKKIAEELNKTTVSLNDVFKQNREWKFHSETPFVLVVPIYAWRIPLKVEDFLKKVILTGNRTVYIVVTMGENAGLASKKKIVLSFSS